MIDLNTMQTVFFLILAFAVITSIFGMVRRRIEEAEERAREESRYSSGIDYANDSDITMMRKGQSDRYRRF